MISSALFISVAESMVILRPIDQVGWARASSTVMAARSLCRVPEEGPARGGQDDAAHRVARAAAARHWKMALCSLSMGMISAPAAAASRLMSSPAATRVSLLARHSRRFRRMAWKAAARPSVPLMAATTQSDPGRETISSRPSPP